MTPGKTGKPIEYSDKSLERPVLAVDVALFGYRSKRLVVLMNNRKTPPFRGAWALPGVAVRAQERLAQAAHRALEEKTSPLDPRTYLEQLAAFDGLYRDPRGRTVAVAFMGVTTAFVTHDRARWFEVGKLKPDSMPFDHHSIVKAGEARLQGKLRYTNLACRMLAEVFVLDDLVSLYEGLLQRKLNRANFRSKLLKVGLIEKVGFASEEVGEKGGRPAHQYRFTSSDVCPWGRDFL